MSSVQTCVENLADNFSSSSVIIEASQLKVNNDET